MGSLWPQVQDRQGRGCRCWLRRSLSGSTLGRPFRLAEYSRCQERRVQHASLARDVSLGTQELEDQERRHREPRKHLQGLRRERAIGYRASRPRLLLAELPGRTLERIARRGLHGQGARRLLGLWKRDVEQQRREVDVLRWCNLATEEELTRHLVVGAYQVTHKCER